MNGVRIGLALVVAVAGMTLETSASARSAQDHAAASTLAVLPDPAQGLAGRIVWTRKPTGDEISAARPARVVKERVSGGAVLDCLATAAGALEDCKVASEAPLDYGFGAAALRLADRYRIAARTATGELTAGARVRAPVTFNAGRVGGTMTVMAYPIWTQVPTLDEVDAAYPEGAGEAAGKAVVRCAFDVEGGTTDCQVQSETPANKGFGPAALALADRFVVLHTDDEAAILPGVIADISIAFRKPEAALGRMPQPELLTAVSAAGANALFPAAARERAVTNGVGTVDCLVTNRGGMTECRILGDRPTDLGFGDAAVQVAQQMRINAWSRTGRTYAGRRLTIPIRLRLLKPGRAIMARSPPVTTWGWTVQDLPSARR